MQLLDGKKLSKDIKQELKEAVAKIVAEGKRPPHLVAILVGDNGASRTYVKSKMRACNFVGFWHGTIQLPATISQEELVEEIEKCNADPEIDGILVQLPLPKHIDSATIIEAISPKKDVDGFHPLNLGLMARNLPCPLPATPAGILEMMKRYNVPTKGKHCVVIGRSHIVGSPMSMLMARNTYPGNCTVTLTHRHTPPEELKRLTKLADIVIVAVGIPGFVTADMVKEGATIIDVGITRVEDASKKRGYSIKGDVDFEGVKEKVGFLTPVPGGVGPMTVGMLLTNTLRLYERYAQN